MHPLRHHLGIASHLSRLSRWLCVLLCTAASWSSAPSGRAQPPLDAQRIDNVKVATLYAFARYIVWPAEAFQNGASPFVIGVLGPTRFRTALDVVAAKRKLDDHPIVIRDLKSPQECQACHLVFVSNEVAPEIEAEVIRQAAGRPILLVGETPGFIERGGTANFFQADANVRFELDPERGMAVQLHFNAKLLTLNAKPTSAR